MKKPQIDLYNPFLKDFIDQVNRQKTKQAILFGPMPSKPLEKMKKEPPHSLVGCPALFIDGGLKYLTDILNLPLKGFPSSYLTLGDGDSSVKLAQKLQLSFPQEKDISDLGLGLQILDFLALPLKTIQLFGFLGGDKGHEWCGIFEVARWLNKKSQGLAHFDQALTICSPGCFSLYHKGGFSLFTLQESRSQLEGSVKYPLSKADALIPQSSHGLSNHAEGPFTWESNQVGFFFWRTL